MYVCSSLNFFTIVLLFSQINLLGSVIAGERKDQSGPELLAKIRAKQSFEDEALAREVRVYFEDDKIDFKDADRRQKEAGLPLMSSINLFKIQRGLSRLNKYLSDNEAASSPIIDKDEFGLVLGLSLGLSFSGLSLMPSASELKIEELQAMKEVFSLAKSRLEADKPINSGDTQTHELDLYHSNLCNIVCKLVTEEPG